MQTRVCFRCKFWQPSDRDRSYVAVCAVSGRKEDFNSGCKSYEPVADDLKANKDYSQYYSQLGYYPGIFFDLQDKE